jgi:hypothetical protein
VARLLAATFSGNDRNSSDKISGGPIQSEGASAGPFPGAT